MTHRHGPLHSPKLTLEAMMASLIAVIPAVFLCASALNGLGAALLWTAQVPLILARDGLALVAIKVGALLMMTCRGQPSPTAARARHAVAIPVPGVDA